MKHISILVPVGQYSIVNIGGAFQLLNWATDIYFQETRKRLFEIDLVGIKKPADDAEGFYSVSPTKTIDSLQSTDLIIVPAVHGDPHSSIEQNKTLIEWIKTQHQQGAEVASFCIGVYLLAQTGILNGKTCSTHWGHADRLRKMFPEIDVQAENLITDSNGVYTSGGAYAFTNLIIYLIEKYGGRELAILTAKAFMIDIDKGKQSAFMMFSGQKDHHDTLVLQVQEHLESHFIEKTSIDELAEQHATGRRTLERRFKTATGNSINEYTQRVRIEAAKKQLETGRKTVAEVMYEVGYNDDKAFRDVFRKYTGISPVEYRDKYNYRYANLK